MLNDLYLKQWNLYFNFFIPSMKFIAKHRVGSKVIKRYDMAQTPFQRILQSPSISAEVKTQLKKQYRPLNPFQFQKEMSRKITAIMNNITP